MSTQEPFISLPPEWEAGPQTVAITTFAYQGRHYTVSTIDRMNTPNYELLQALASYRDELKPGCFLPALRYETRVFLDGEDARVLNRVYDTWREASLGHEECLGHLKKLLTSGQETNA